jgi:hypothetical protein
MSSQYGSTDMASSQQRSIIGGGAVANGIIANVLAQVLNTRLQRKAKAIIISSLEFLLTDLSILLTALNLEIEDDGIKIGIYVVVGFAALYAAALVIFLLVHASFFTDKNSTTEKEVEDAFSKTNAAPLVDGFLELPFPAKFGGNTWFLPYIMWSFFLAIIVTSSVLFAFEYDQISGTTVAALSTGGLLLYQITSDFSEYWVLSRNQEIVEASAAGGDEAFVEDDK